MNRTAAENALATAERLATAAEFAAAWAAGEFKTVTPAEAWAAGFDAESNAPQIHETRDGSAAAIWNEETSLIEFTDAEAFAWTISPETGELRQA
ncbi:hypothetical protein ACGYJ8_14475 [Sulfitobacter sp. 1A12126]|uniref:hypothetical protein n=1 Tax=Sulfitobacter sp. 1A12126 TaxID=3368591 RepID=UPI0037468822